MIKARCVKVEAIAAASVANPYGQSLEWRSTLQSENEQSFGMVVVTTEHPVYEPNQLYEVTIRKVDEQ